ncbi:6-pyruvoyl trahydropterin synthase family protein [Nonomuraea candida]|uniref:6-pyruvoyl trahydropterin synthase family protein n=1 Tax=Nonomuraea candida TaxID=359159 RepID=UPI000694C763|nr:6-carboxytetrahydropterin synthase [Nonomuraea candida]
MFTGTVEHTWEAGHSLPHLPGKCSSLHGHTWRASITVAGPSLDQAGILVEFGAFKRHMRDWIDSRLDHSLMLGAGDNLIPLLDLDRPAGEPAPPLAAAFTERAQRLFVFGRDFPDTPWPSVEGVAQLLAHHAHTWLEQATTRSDVYVSQVTVRETDSNSATWHNPHPPTTTAASAVRAEATQALGNMPPGVLRELLTATAPHTAADIARDMGVPLPVARYYVDQVYAEAVAAQQAKFDNEIAQILHTPDK